MPKPVNIIGDIPDKHLGIFSFFKKKPKNPNTILYKKTTEYRGLVVLFSVDELEVGERSQVKVSVSCDAINKGNYTNTGIDEKDILSAFDNLFITVKKSIDNFLDYDKNIQAALAKIDGLPK